MYAANTNADSGMSCSPATYRRKAPIGGCLYKKLLDLLFAHISLKCNLDAVEKGYYLIQ
jgi:hypothetical protein